MEENYNKNEENSKLGAGEKDRSNQGTQNTPNNANNSNTYNYNNNSGGYYNNNYNNGYSNNNYNNNYNNNDNNNGYNNYNNGNNNNNYASQESKTAMGVLFALFLGVIGLLIGMCMYPQNSYERKTFVSGWIKTFVICIAVAAVFTIIAVVVVAGSAY